MTAAELARARRFERIVGGVLDASAGPLTAVELLAIVRGFGHPDAAGIDVMTALSRLAQVKRIRITQKAQFISSGGGPCSP